jgi:hypothetical protein
VNTLVTGRTKPSPEKSTKTGSSKKRSHEEAGNVGQSSSRPAPPNPAKEWKKSKLKTKIEDILALVNSGFLQEKEMDLWHASTGNAYLMEKNSNEIPMFLSSWSVDSHSPQSSSSRGCCSITTSST